MIPQYRFGLPKACKCMNCGYVVKNPGKHCPEIRCPRCGGRMRRAWELESQGSGEEMII